MSSCVPECFMLRYQLYVTRLLIFMLRYQLYITRLLMVDLKLSTICYKVTYGLCKDINYM